MLFSLYEREPPTCNRSTSNLQSLLEEFSICVEVIAFVDSHSGWRDGRVAEGGGLLNRCTVKSRTGGSNPPLSASLPSTWGSPSDTFRYLPIPSVTFWPASEEEAERSFPRSFRSISLVCLARNISISCRSS